MKNGKGALIMLALMVLAVQGLAAGGNKEEPLEGAEAAPEVAEEAVKEEIVIGILDDMSGPFAGANVPRSDGTIDYFNYVNSMGGIDGHMIKPVVADTKFNVDLMNAGWDELRGAGVLWINSSLPPLMPQLVEKSNTDRIVLLGTYGYMEQYFPVNESYVFFTTPAIYRLVTCFFDRVEELWRQSGKSGTPVVAMNLVDGAGAEPNAYLKAWDMEVKARGWKNVVTRIALRPTDAKAQIAQWMALGAQYGLVIGNSPGQIAVFAEMKANNYRPAIFSGNGMAALINLQAIGPDIAGTEALVTVPTWEEDVPLVALCKKLNMKWYGEFRYIEGVLQGMIVVNAFTSAIKTVGFEALNSDALVKAMYTTMDLGAGQPYSWSEKDRQGAPGGRWYRWTTEGTIVPMGRYFTFDYTPEERTSAYWFGK